MYDVTTYECVSMCVGIIYYLSVFVAVFTDITSVALAPTL